ncbi:ABC transporter ATP-binding protein [Candidatus Contubernalis alkaliaceticus]|uniref:ABC transporter ATP-binding protein n=1 Tax=Candidatus Contubernalis alkaliaceticus TaxID=338645 RepID=UPI001F4BDB04|nr:ATP-binding cassette domain-containing protein [Candidatus Contubernalis alkalaceticus]UNC91974.1 ABC transporter ATP-binding protein [Candidatus Contubernalis alkalaceticus]
MGQPVLSVRGLRKSFGDKVVVKDVSFDVCPGEIFGVLGPNGAGKTTAIRMIMGVMMPDQGEVNFRLNGKTGLLDKTKLGYLPEERGLYDNVKVIQTLIYLGELKGVSTAEAKKRALEWLEVMNLVEYAESKLEKLSKGMQQKIQFIASVLHRPDLVLLDEPFSGLDPINQDLFKELIRKLQGEGITILLSAHQMSVVEELCNRIFLIDKGEEILYGTVQGIKDDYHQYSVNLSFTQGEALHQFLTLLPEVKSLHITSEKADFRISSSFDLNDFINQLTSYCHLERVVIQKPPLHEIFVNTVRERGMKNV